MQASCSVSLVWVRDFRNFVDSTLLIQYLVNLNIKLPKGVSSIYPNIDQNGSDRNASLRVNPIGLSLPHWIEFTSVRHASLGLENQV